MNRYVKKGRTQGSKSLGSVSGTKTYTTFPKCGKNHLSKCLTRKEGYFRCGEFSHKLRDCPFKQGQGSGNGRAQSTT